MEILYSDKNIAVCVKPVGLDSEQEVPQSLKDALGGEIFPLHRLDKNVGGVMIFARTKPMPISRNTNSSVPRNRSKKLWKQTPRHMV